MPVECCSLPLTPANLFIWNQHDCGDFTSTPTGDPSGRTKQSRIFYAEKNVSLSAEFPIWLNGFTFISKLKNPGQSRFWEQWSFQRFPHLWEKMHKNKIRSLQRKRTGPSEATLLIHFLLTLCNSSFLLSYLKCFSFLLAQLPTGKKIKKLCDIAASCVFSETN